MLVKHGIVLGELQARDALPLNLIDISPNLDALEVFLGEGPRGLCQLTASLCGLREEREVSTVVTTSFILWNMFHW